MSIKSIMVSAVARSLLDWSEGLTSLSRQADCSLNIQTRLTHLSLLDIADMVLDSLIDTMESGLWRSRCLVWPWTPCDVFAATFRMICILFSSTSVASTCAFRIVHSACDGELRGQCNANLICSKSFDDQETVERFRAPWEASP